jgi:hypothetical protein
VRERRAVAHAEHREDVTMAKAKWLLPVIAATVLMLPAWDALAATDPAAKCAAAKMKAIGKMTNSLAKALGRYVKGGSDAKLELDAAKAFSKLNGAFSKEDAGGGCATTDDLDYHYQHHVIPFWRGLGGTFPPVFSCGGSPKSFGGGTSGLPLTKICIGGGCALSDCSLNEAQDECGCPPFGASPSAAYLDATQDALE